MKKLLILGAGTAGTMLANKLSHELNPDNWKITIVDQDEVHYYQPGFLFIPFVIYHCHWDFASSGGDPRLDGWPVAQERS